MSYKSYRAKYNVGDILSDGRTILEKERIAGTEYKFLLYCNNCKTKNWVKRTSGLKRECVGCGGKIWRYEDKKQKDRNRSFTNYRHRAKKRGYDFSLTRTQFLEIISLPCHWCGFSGSVGVDRVSNNIGYTPENSVSSCKRCNLAKNDMSLEEWQEWISRIAAHNFKG